MGRQLQTLQMRAVDQDVEARRNNTQLAQGSRLVVIYPERRQQHWIHLRALARGAGLAGA